MKDLSHYYSNNSNRNIDYLMQSNKLKKAKQGHLMAPPIKIASNFHHHSNHREYYDSPDRMSIGGLRTPNKKKY